MDQKESNELDIRTLKADFAVDIEEVLTKECSSYECVLCDEHDIGVLWSFLIEDSISGFIGVEDNEDSIGIATVTTGIHLKEITDADRDSLMHILDLNSELINATFTVAHIQDKQEEAEPIFAEEGESIESGLVTRAVENAQKKVEGRNFSIRKNVLQYDDVMNTQREIIYKERKVFVKNLRFIGKICLTLPY